MQQEIVEGSIIHALNVSKQKVGVGVGIIVVKDGQILLGKRKGAHGSGCYGPPGGKLEFRETVEACAARELNEETGLTLLSLQLSSWTQDFIEEKHYISLFVIVQEFEGTLELLEPHKCEGWAWYDFDNLPSPLFQPLTSYIASGKLELIKETQVL